LEGTSHTEMWSSDSDKTLASSFTPPLPTMWPRFSWGIPALVTGQTGSLLYKIGPYYGAMRQSQISQLPPCPLRCRLHPAGNQGIMSHFLSISLCPSLFFYQVSSLQVPCRHHHSTFRVCKDGRFFLMRHSHCMTYLVEDVSCNRRDCNMIEKNWVCQ